MEISDPKPSTPKISEKPQTLLTRTSTITDSLSPKLSYKDNLAGSLDQVFHKAKEGVKTCKALSLLLQQTSTLEDTYGSAIVKVKKMSI